jgi:hypothetical protein
MSNRRARRPGEPSAKIVALARPQEPTKPGPMLAIDDAPRLDPESTLDYMSSMLDELGELADRLQCPTLRGLLTVASSEARLRRVER